MSRYYKIIITNPDGTVIKTPSSVPGTKATYCSYDESSNQSLPAALTVELDIPLRAYATPVGGAFVRIWGITLQEIAQATQWNPTINSDGVIVYKGISVSGGMQKGLPLANPSQIGVLVQGSILQALGNWVGTEQTLDLIIAPDFGSNTNPKNLTFKWDAGTPLKTAIGQTLSTAFPNIKQVFNISDRLVLSNTESGFYNTLEEFAYIVRQLSVTIIKGVYQGVDIFLNNGTFYVADGSVPATPKEISYLDLIGQPTWIDGPTMQFKTVMRGNISIADFIKMPKTLVTTTAAAPSSLINLKAAFQGVFYVNEVRHIGNSRQATADAWVSVFNAAPLLQGTGATAPADEDF